MAVVPPSGNCFIIVDLGTSGPKVALFSDTGEAIDHEFEPNPIHLLPDGGAEQDPEDWWIAIKNALKRLLSRSTIPHSHISAFTVTTQWSGTVAVDRQGNPLTNAIIWMDSRGARHIRKAVKGPLMVEGYAAAKLWKWIRLTGGAPTHSGKDSIAHILYLKNAQPEIYQNTYKFLEPKDYLNLRLTGKFASGHDAITLHWVTDNRDIHHIRYDDRLIRMIGIDREKLPDLHRAVDVLGNMKPDVALELGLPEGIPVIMGTPDLHSAALGSGAVKDYEGHLYIGTSSWLTCHVPFKKTDLLHNMATFPSAIPGKYFIANEQENAGNCLNFLRDNVFFPDDALREQPPAKDFYRKLDLLAAEVTAGCDGLIFTPWLYGERSPVDDHFVRGGFFNLSLRSERKHMVRAVMEGVAFNSRWLLKYVEKMTKRPFEWINMIGGGANSDIWCQIHADILNRPIRQVEDPILANARGAAYLTSVALGIMTFDEIGSHVNIKNTYLPDPDKRKLYDKLFKVFLEIYSRNKKIYRRLNN
jgi:xylulokinase